MEHQAVDAIGLQGSCDASHSLDRHGVNYHFASGWQIAVSLPANVERLCPELCVLIQIDHLISRMLSVIILKNICKIT